MPVYKKPQSQPHRSPEADYSDAPKAKHTPRSEILDEIDEVLEELESEMNEEIRDNEQLRREVGTGIEKFAELHTLREELGRAAIYFQEVA